MTWTLIIIATLHRGPAVAMTAEHVDGFKSLAACVRAGRGLQEAYPDAAWSCAAKGDSE